MSQKPGPDGPPSAAEEPDDEGESDQRELIESVNSPAHYQTSRLHTPTHSVIDEDSHRFFMSEPSISEDGEASSGHRIRAPHRVRLFGRHHHSSDEDDHPRVNRRVPSSPYAGLSAPSSPGNTSLSSWDSPAPGKRTVHVHFTPPPLQSQTSTASSSAGEYHHNMHSTHRYIPPPGMPTDNHIHEEKKIGMRATSSSSGPPPIMPSPPHRPITTQQQTTDDADSYFLRQLQYVTSTAANSNNNTDFQGHLFGRREHYNNNHSQRATDESIAMTLSDSDPDDEAGNQADASAQQFYLPSLGKVSSSQQEAYVLPTRSNTRQPPQKNNTSSARPVKQAATHMDTTTATPSNNISKPKGHRRTRSGDAAAAKIATGGQEWKGMRSQKIPMPVHEDDDDDDEEEEEDPGHKKPDAALQRRSGRVQRVSGTGNNGQQPLSGQQRTEETTQLIQQRPSVATRANTYGSTATKPPPVRLASTGSWPPKTFHLPPSAWTPPSTPPMYPYGRKQPSGSAPSEASASSGIPENGTDSSETSSDEYSGSSDRPMNVQGAHIRLEPDSVNFSLEQTEKAMDDPKYRGNLQKVLRHSLVSESPFANIGKKSSEKAPRSTFLPQAPFIDDDTKTHNWYICPRCKTRQREFFTVDDAPRQLEGTGSYLALYFSIYVISSLFIFGLEEGWETGDCIYFAVVTLTTAGLGDFVPTSPANKIICSIFIYFGVACIGLLLGSYIAGMLDDKAYRDRKNKLVEACPNCARVQMLKETASSGRKSVTDPNSFEMVKKFSSERNQGAANVQEAKYTTNRLHHLYRNGSGVGSGLALPTISQNAVSDSFPAPRDRASSSESTGSPAVGAGYAASPASSGSASGNYLLGSPVTRNILGRQSHTRHDSFDFTSSAVPSTATPAVRRLSHDNIRTPTINESFPVEPSSDPTNQQWTNFDDGDDDESSSEPDSEDTFDEIVDEGTMKVKAIKYVFITLKQALMNSMVIIAVGCLGFWFIEGFSVVDSWYFTTVFLTTVGYGDIVPVTKGGKLFATIYILVAGTILLNNMSSISMIPLELRRRRIERAVLTQFGDQLDDSALRELATGALIQRLRLSANRPDGLDECTREMFSLAMLVRLGKVSEQDIRESFAAFRRLDVNNEGILNSKSIIAAMIQKRRSMHASASMTNLLAAAEQEQQAPPPPPPRVDQRAVYWRGQSGSLHVDTPVGEFTFTDAEEIRRSERMALLQSQFQPPADDRSRLLSDVSAQSMEAYTRGNLQHSKARESPF